MNAPIEESYIFPTLEQHFIVNPLADADINTSVLMAALQRANAIILLIEADGEDIETGFTLRHDFILNALDSVQGNIKQAMQIVSHYEGGAK